MATRPNVYNPGAVAPIKRSPKDVNKGALTDAALEDSWSAGWMGQIIRGAQREGREWQQATPDFDYRQHIPAGYESYAEFFKGSDTEDEIKLRAQHLKENIALRQRRDARGGWSTFASDLVTGTLDPINLIGAPALKGAGLLAGAGKGALALGGAGAATELVRGGLDPTATKGEIALGVASNLALGATIGGIAGSVGRGGRVNAVPGVARSRPYINPKNTAAVEQAFTHLVQQESSGGKNIIGRPTRVKGGAVVQAMGAAQVIDSTAKAMAEKLGMRWDPALMRQKTPEGYDYQLKIGRAYFQEGLDRYGGDLSKALAYYHGGPDQTQWGPKTRKYVSEVLGRIGYSGEGVQLGRNPVETLNALELVHVPEEVALPDGRGIPVKVGPTGNGSLASFVKAKSGAEVAGEVALEEAQHAARQANVHGEPSWFDGLKDVRHTDVPKVVQSWAARASREPAFREQLGLPEGFTLQDVDAVVSGERKRQLIAETQRQVDEGTFKAGRPEAPEPEPHVSALKERRTLQRQIDRLKARAAGIEKAILRHGDDLKIPMTERKVWDPEQRRWKAKGEDWRPADEVLDELDDELGALITQLDEAGGPVDPDIAAGELSVGSAFADEADLFVDGQRGLDAPDEDLAALAVEDRQKRDRDFDSGELADELPFGLGHGDAEGTYDGAHFRIDQEAILNLFEEKPWTRPRLEGVAPFPEDAFRTPGEWLQFVIAHELEHSWNPRMEGEALPDYENRINQQAWAKVQADRAPGGIAGNRLQKLAFAATPSWQLERLIPDLDAPIHKDFMEMTSDMAMQTAANIAGRPSIEGGKNVGWAGDLVPQGGSVFQRALRWQAKLFDIRDAIRRNYLEDIGLSQEGTRVGIELSVLAQRIPFVGNGRKSFKDFKAEVAAAQIGNVPGITPSTAAIRAAATLNHVANLAEEEARKLGMFRKTGELVGRIEKIKRNIVRQDERIARMEARGADTGPIVEIREQLQQQVETLTHEAQQPIMQPGETRHYHRIYNTAALLENPSDAMDRLRLAFERDGHSDPARAAEDAFHLITQDPTGGIRASGTAAGLRAFELPWTNAEAFPYIVQDPELAYGIYLRRMGAQIEMTRTFGDPDALDRVDELRADLFERGYSEDKVNQAMQVFLDGRDRIVGGLHGKNPLSWDNRTARVLKNVGSMAVLGKVIYSQLADVSRFITTQGLGAKRVATGEGNAGLIQALLGAVHGDVSRFNRGGVAKLAGEALELAQARHMALQIESDDAFLITRDTRFERALALAQVPFFVLNLLTPFTVMMKEMAGLVAAHNLIDEAKSVAGAIQRGEEPDADMLTRLAHMGLDRGDAQILAAMPTEGGAGGLHLPNVLAWEGDRGSYMRSKFLSAVNGEIRRTVITPGPADRPVIFDGIFHSKARQREGYARVDEAKARYEAEKSPEAYADWQDARRNLGRAGRIEAPLASLPFQLHSFTMASGAKMLHGLLTSRERNKFGGILSMFVAGAYITWLKTESDNQWKNMGWGEYVSQTVDRSNIGVWFTDIIKSIDTFYDLPIVDGEVDPNNESIKDEVGASFGVSSGLLTGLVEPFVRSDLSDARAAGVRRIIPFNNLIWWDSVVDKVEHAIAGDHAKRGHAAAAPMTATRAGVSHETHGAMSEGDLLTSVPEGQLPMLDHTRLQELPDVGDPGPLPPRKKPKKGRHPHPPRGLGF